MCRKYEQIRQVVEQMNQLFIPVGQLDQFEDSDADKDAVSHVNQTREEADCGQNEDHLSVVDLRLFCLGSVLEQMALNVGNKFNSAQLG